MLGLCPYANSESTCSPSALSFTAPGESQTDSDHLLLSLFGIPPARHSGLGGGEEDGRRGISNAEKVLDAVKDYVEMGEVWA